MSWRQVFKKINPTNIIDCLADWFESIVEIWAILRVTIILALVLYTIVINLHTNFDERCDNEILDTVDSTLCRHHDSWGIHP